ncbi:MAG: hypothetical protein RL077_3139 [Verrucomicrobiota bacterium]|jgi:hypothetical protein
MASAPCADPWFRSSLINKIADVYHSEDVRAPGAIGVGGASGYVGF